MFYSHYISCAENLIYRKAIDGILGEICMDHSERIAGFYTMVSEQQYVYALCFCWLCIFKFIADTAAFYIRGQFLRSIHRHVFHLCCTISS